MSRTGTSFLSRAEKAAVCCFGYVDDVETDKPLTPRIELGLCFRDFGSLYQFNEACQKRTAEIADERLKNDEYAKYNELKTSDCPAAEDEFWWEDNCKEKLVYDKLVPAFVLDTESFDFDYIDGEDDTFIPSGLLAFWDMLCSNCCCCQLLKVSVCDNG